LHGRSVERYFQDFVNGIAGLDTEIVVFIDKSSRPKLEAFLKKSEIKAQLVFVDTELNQLPFFGLKQRLIDVLSSPTMRFYSLRDRMKPWHKVIGSTAKALAKRLLGLRTTIWDDLPIGNPKAPEYLNWEYLVLTWSKPWLMVEAYKTQILDAVEPVLWADFGLGHSQKSFSQEIKKSSPKYEVIPPGKIVLSRRVGSEIKFASPWEVAEFLDDASVPAGLIGASLPAIQELNNFFANQIHHWLSQDIAPDDQVLLALFCSQMPKMVELLEQSDKFDGWYQIQGFLEPRR
jgi:hypothetical protein